MSNKRFVKPAREGLVVRDPTTSRALPATGGWVVWSGYWARRRAEGSIVDAKPPAKPKRKATPKAPVQARGDSQATDQESQP